MTNTDKPIPEMLDEFLTEECQELVEQTITTALMEHRRLLVSGIAGRIRPLLTGSAEQNIQGVSGEDTWQPVRSLSAIRALAGGRFSNLKEMWIGSGFPLREHRGDDAGTAEVNMENWIRFSSWLMDRGYEAKLADSAEDCFFQVRRISGA